MVRIPTGIRRPQNVFSVKRLKTGQQRRARGETVSHFLYVPLPLFAAPDPYCRCMRIEIFWNIL